MKLSKRTIFAEIPQKRKHGDKNKLVAKAGRIERNDKSLSMGMEILLKMRKITYVTESRAISPMSEQNGKHLIVTQKRVNFMICR